MSRIIPIPALEALALAAFIAALWASG